MAGTTVRVPQVQDLETAIRLYYERNELSSADIKALFGCSESTVAKLKRLAKERMLEEGTISWNALQVNTEAAWRAWGLDITKMEQGLRRLRQLRLRD